ncbi:hypothetical protein L6452_17742 [Arctium lappa]|uniref:Uncharacterized protein n=1 Tax=Arctium lappa TaxID=4217 RepID=A0ACB9C4H3_ARCLA|nr:hypothetical protein L6452_17742 [Arctium lappa]
MQEGYEEVGVGLDVGRQMGGKVYSGGVEMIGDEERMIGDKEETEGEDEDEENRKWSGLEAMGSGGDGEKTIA